MSKVETERKLELVRHIRMQNQDNRAKCREREQLLYGIQVPFSQNERYNAEIVEEPSFSAQVSSFRLRFVVAILLFAAFVFFDKNQMDIFGMTMEEIYLWMQQSFAVDKQFIGNLFDL